jgi:hypothetical protein
MYCFCVVLCFVYFLSLCVLFVCKCVLYYYHRVSTQLQLTNISYIISYHIIANKSYIQEECKIFDYTVRMKEENLLLVLF